MTRNLIVLGTLFVGLQACQQDPYVGVLPANVGSSFASCNEAEIKFLAAKHNFMPAFRYCGNNNFQDFSWNPAGTHLYFRLVMTPAVMDAASPTKPTTTLTIPTPTDAPAWMSNSQLVLPVGPEEDSETPRIALYNLDQKSVFFTDMSGFRSIHDLQRAEEKGEVLFIGETTDGKRGVHRVRLSDGRIDQPWPELAADIDTFTFTHQLGVATIGRGSTVQLYDTRAQKVVDTFEQARRGTLHPKGEWLALEHDGAEISVFYQRAWDELSPEMREREMRRAKKFEQGLPESYPRTVKPPTLSFVDMTNEEKPRWQVSSIYGWDFQWYEGRDLYGSLLFWGFEGKELKRNIMLGQWSDRLNSMRAGKDYIGVEPFPKSTTAAPAEPGKQD